MNEIEIITCDSFNDFEEGNAHLPLKNFDVKQFMYILLSLLALHFLFHSILYPIKYSINYLCSGGIVNMKHPE